MCHLADHTLRGLTEILESGAPRPAAILGIPVGFVGAAESKAALAASGLLVPTIGGPSVRPWMPDGVWDETSKYGDLRGYKPDTGAGRYRRSMYTVWKRTAAPPTMLLFDALTACEEIDNLIGASALIDGNTIAHESDAF